MNNLCESCPGHPAECHAKISEVTFQSDIRPGVRGTAADAIVECTQYLQLTTQSFGQTQQPTERGAA